ncbi:MAG: YegP family protein [Clostridiales bacterium]|nr:YegP family protein [Clostridiales bacterium]
MSKYVIHKTKTGYTFHLKAANGETIGVSEAYSSEAACENGIESVRKSAVAAAVEDKTAEQIETIKNPKFELYKDARGEFRFRLCAVNGQNILASEGYTVKESCKNGIVSVKKNAQDAKIEKSY